MPMQLRGSQISRNVLSNLIGMAAALAAGFFLAPFIIHRLGNAAYGIWVLAVSSVSYLNLLDLGLRSAVLRFVSKGNTTSDHRGASEALSAALWLRMQISIVILILCAGLAAVFPIVFKVPQASVLDAREAILIVGFSTAVTMSFGVIGVILSAVNRYDLVSGVGLIQLLIRVIAVILVLRAGFGIVAIAGSELLASLVANLLLLLIARKVYPELEIRLTKPRREILRQLWSYSVYSFLLIVAIQLVYQTDNLVVGAFVSASAVTFYSIGNSLCRYTQQVVSAMTITFTPAASSYEAADDSARLRRLFFNGTVASMVLALPILLTLIFRGANFIGLWIGPQYSGISGNVVKILACGLIFSLANSTAASIALGIEKHKTVARWAIAEAFANLSLSIILARGLGIVGVAFGTLAPSLVVHLILWPRYLPQLVHVSRAEVFRKVWGPLFLCSLPFALASYAMDRLWPARNLVVFLLQTAASCPFS